MKAICFLGTTAYRSTTYAWNGLEMTTQFFPAAVARFLKPARLLVCATPTVQKHENLSQLTAQLEVEQTPWSVVPIPEGHSEADLWGIFDALTAAVDEQEEVAFDVTHSFRSLPILAFLAVAYLKAAKRVRVAHVLYGAWEARDEAANRSPVFDLTPFVALLDWLTATNRFVETGDGQALSGLLKAGMPLGAEMRDDLAARALGRHLRAGADAIESVSLALRVTRPLETMQAAAQLQATLEQALPSILARAKPFAVLADQVSAEYGQFALDNPGEPSALADGLWHQLHMVDWYLQRRHVVQAATLAREWIVSVLALQFGEPMFDHEHGRKHVEAALNNAVERRKPRPRAITPGRCDERLEALPVANELARLWSEMTELRNDIAHVGMKTSPKPAALLKQNIASLYPRLDALAQRLLPPPAVNP